MNFGEKIFRLRKERGLSQEALAEQAGTTRQAVSKWENSQGFPETEKLLLLSNIFEVSIDYLLKDDQTGKASEKGYYVSREMAQGFLSNEKRVSKYIGLGFMFFASAGIPFTMFLYEGVWRFSGIAICVVLGIIAIAAGAFAESKKYEVLKQEPLLFDYEYLNELTKEYHSRKKKYLRIEFPCVIMFIVGILAVAVTVRGYMEWSRYHSVLFLCLAAGLFGFVYSAGTMEAYEILVDNKQYSTRLLFKLKRKIRNKIVSF